MSNKDDWICRSCKWEGNVDEIIKHLTFAATLEEPDEWVWYCPDCNRSDNLEELYENATWCRTCEDEIVQNEGDQCMECITAHAEMLSDAAKGH
jgi:hypothetical protein